MPKPVPRKKYRESRGRALVVTTPEFKIQFADPVARRWLKQFFGRPGRAREIEWRDRRDPRHKTRDREQASRANLSQARRGKPHCGDQSRFERLIRLTIRKKIDTRIGKFAPVAQPFQIVAEIEAVHAI